MKESKWICGNSYKKKILVDSLKEKINIIQEVIIDSKGEIPIHSHKFTNEIFYVTKNSAIIIINKKENRVKEGDIIYVKKGKEHGFRNESEKNFKMIVFKINFKKGDSYLKI